MRASNVCTLHTARSAAWLCGRRRAVVLRKPDLRALVCCELCKRGVSVSLSDADTPYGDQFPLKFESIVLMRKARCSDASDCAQSAQKQV